MISVLPDARNRGASVRATLALVIAASAAVASCGRGAAPAKVVAPAKLVAPEAQIAVGLDVGDRAPDFEAQDVEGARFRLSDYRGKVVVLDFWGFW